MVCSPTKLFPKPCLAGATDEACRVWAKINLTVGTGPGDECTSFPWRTATGLLSLKFLRYLEVYAKQNLSNT